MDLISQSDTFLRERDAIIAEKASHAYLIEGEKGIGKFTFALDLACTFFCTGENKPCRKCASCRKVFEFNHPDVHIFEPDRNIFRVDQVREIISTLYESPYEGGKKVYIIKEFHKANPAAQNALLKTLEEPPEPVCFFLLTENAHAALPTVRSRCKHIRLMPQKKENIFTELERRFPQNEKNRFAAEKCGGIIGTAVSLVSDEEFLRVFNLSDEILKETDKASPSYPRIAQIFEKEKSDLLLGLLYRGFAEKFRQNPTGINLQRIKAVQDAADGKTKRFNEGLINERLAYTLAKGGTKWQR